MVASMTTTLPFRNGDTALTSKSIILLVFKEHGWTTMKSYCEKLCKRDNKRNIEHIRISEHQHQSIKSSAYQRCWQSIGRTFYQAGNQYYVWVIVGYYCRALTTDISSRTLKKLVKVESAAYRSCAENDETLKHYPQPIATEQKQYLMSSYWKKVLILHGTSYSIEILSLS